MPDLWEIIQGDALGLLRDLPDASVDAVITDPPYSERTHKGHDAGASPGIDGARRKTLGYAPWRLVDVWRVVPELCRVSSGWVVIMTDHTLAPAIAEAMKQCSRYVFAPLPFYLPGCSVRLTGDGPSSWTQWIIVGRTTKQHRWGTLPGGYTGTGSEWRDRVHMGGKPTGLMRALVRDYSRLGNTVLDPFAGSGTTGVACKIEGRSFVGFEMVPEYARIARQRIAASVTPPAVTPRARDLPSQRVLFAEGEPDA